MNPPSLPQESPAPPAPPTKPRFRGIYGLVFIAWIIAPAVVALLCIGYYSSAKSTRWDGFVNDNGIAILVWIGLSWISCSLACSWMVGRVTRRWWVKLLVAFFLGLGIFLVNLIIAVFASCSMMHVTM
jgi:hypothetical protein